MVSVNLIVDRFTKPMPRIVLPTILSATFSLMSDVYTDPNDEHAIGNVKLIASFVRFLENLQRQGCDILRLSEGCAKLARITRCLILKEQCTLHKAVRVSYLIDIMVYIVELSLIIY